MNNEISVHQKTKFTFLLLNIHGLFRGHNLELGRDSDTGGQTKYVLEYAQALAQHQNVDQVYVLTRLINDKRYSVDYATKLEKISENLSIVRVHCGGNRYIKKEKLWSSLDEFIDNSLKFIIDNNLNLDIVHSHYADAGYVGVEIAKFLNIPLIHTGHSLGIPKRQKLIENAVDLESLEKDYMLSHRINVENNIIKNARMIVTSTQQEIMGQYSFYENHNQGQYSIIPPGVSLNKFYPEVDPLVLRTEEEEVIDENGYETKLAIKKELRRFLLNPQKPLILSICRPEKRKNIEGLIIAYGLDKELQEMANLAIFAGIRKDISQKNRQERKILMDMLLLMDKYDLYGKLAIPKKHDFELEIPELYRYASQLNGVFVNPGYHEPFGLTLLEAAASGLPLVATNNGGPIEIIKNCKNGILIDVRDYKEISQAIKTIISDSQKWHEFSVNGIKNVRKYYSWNTYCETLLSKLVSSNILTENNKQKASLFSLRDKLFSSKNLIITDIDDTLLGNKPNLDQFLFWLKENRQNFGFGVATGRNIDSALEVLKEHNVPVPEILITSVGTEIYYYNGKELLFDKPWATYLNEKWQPEKIKELLKDFTFLKLQEDNRNYKVSFYIENYSSEKIKKLHYVLKAHKLKYKFILTEHYYIDILPYRASKYKAIVYILNKWRLSADKTLVFGDSGNDREMLSRMKNATVVANYKKELAGLRNAFFSPEENAGAILDGLKHYNFI